MEEFKSLTDILEQNSESLQMLETIDYENPRADGDDDFSFSSKKLFPNIPSNDWMNRHVATTKLRISPLRLFHRITNPKVYTAMKRSIITRCFGSFTYVFVKQWDKTKIKKKRFLSGVNVMVVHHNKWTL